jgi:pimeloyl-ACP methyl ester carboxylesterase
MLSRSLLRGLPLAVKELKLSVPTPFGRRGLQDPHPATGWCDGRRYSPEGGRVPVVLVHGYGATVSVWSPLQRRLQAAGYGRVVTAGYNATTTDFATVCAGVAELCRAVTMWTGNARVHLVGHSLGGLVARRVAQCVGPAVEVETLVTVATPHRGSHAARLTVGKCARVMRPGCTWLADLQGQPLQQHTSWLNYYSELDLVVPRSSARIHDDRALNVVVQGRGHQGIASSPFFVDHLTAHLVAADARVRQECA